MRLFQIFLIAVLIIVSVYTFIVIQNYGINLFAPFFGDMAAMTWAGQFNLDFMFMLALSALWTAWRNEFSASGLVLAVFAFLGGIIFLSVYLLFLTKQTNGDIHRVLIGNR